MALFVCPAGIAEASVKTVWALVSEPDSFLLWADVDQVLICEPQGALAPGQRIVMRASGFGLRFKVVFEIKSVDPGRHVIELDVKLPLGVVNHERIACQPTDDGRTLIRFY